MCKKEPSNYVTRILYIM